MAELERIVDAVVAAVADRPVLLIAQVAADDARDLVGVGQATLEKYGAAITAIVSEYCRAHAIPAQPMPEQAINNAVVGPDQARAAIRKAYDRMNATARAKAEYGLFNALERIGQPDAIPLPSVRPINTTGN